MTADQGMWDAMGTLTLDRSIGESDVDLPPLQQDDDAVRPLRALLEIFARAPEALRSRYSLRLQNGQALDAHDIADLLARDDCPVEDRADDMTGERLETSGKVTRDVGGVQGSPPVEGEETIAADAPKIGSPKDEPAPDAGEIEWAGGLIRKPPHPDAD